ncbi:hypothetical protein ES703_94801 [subsurface metagenome]
MALLLADELKAAAIVEHEGVLLHKASEPLRLEVKLADDTHVAHVRLHYRTVDQNAEFKVVSMEKTGHRQYTGVIPAADLDPVFDEMYYFEVVDRLGNGSFHPDPFTGERYFVVKVTT